MFENTRTTLTTASGERRLLKEHPRADVGGVLIHPTTGAVQAAAANRLRNEWTAIDPARLEAALAALPVARRPVALRTRVALAIRNDTDRRAVLYIMRAPR